LAEWAGVRRRSRWRRSTTPRTKSRFQAERTPPGCPGPGRSDGSERPTRRRTR
jgi:hypothetical protein